jgi:predicted GNAT family N-acyltransferase
VYDDEDLVASCRIIKPKEKRLEFELYQHISNLIPLRMPRVELNRFAVKSEYIHGRAVIELFLEVLEHCLDEKIATLFISAPAAMVPICLNLGFTETKSQEFRYFPSDPQPSRILCLDFTDRDRIEGIHRRCRNIS